MKEELFRTAMLIGDIGVDILNNSSVIVFGVGGVGSYAVEALSRCGLKRLDVVDADVVSISNINRQIVALHSTVGEKKVNVAKERILDISPVTLTDTYDIFYDENTKISIDLSKYDYIVDAIDSMDSKILLVKEAKKSGVPIISALSTGNKINPSRFVITDIYNTSVCPIAKIMRKRLKEENIDSLKVIYSTEPPISSKLDFEHNGGRKPIGSISFVPSVVGLMMAGEVVSDLIKKSETK